MDTYPYPYFGTAEDNPDNLLSAFGNSVNLMENAVRLAAEIAGRMALRLTHDRELYLDYKSYDSRLHSFVAKLLPYQKEMKVKGRETGSLRQGSPTGGLRPDEAGDKLPRSCRCVSWLLT